MVAPAWRMLASGANLDGCIVRSPRSSLLEWARLSGESRHGCILPQNRAG
jgi:hypothetical protein